MGEGFYVSDVPVPLYHMSSRLGKLWGARRDELAEL